MGYPKIESQIIHLDKVYTVSSNTDTSNYDGKKYMAQEKAPSLLQWNDFKNLTQRKQEADSVAPKDECRLLVQKKHPQEESQEADSYGRQISSSMQVTKVLAKKHRVLEYEHRKSDTEHDVKKLPVSTDIKRGSLRLDGSMSCTYPIRFKTYVFMILLSFHLSDAMNIQPPTEHDQSLTEIQTFVSLSTSYCNPSNLDMTQTCLFPGSDKLRDLLDYCEFNKTCLSGYTPVCVNTEKGMAFICAPMHPICKKGHWWRVMQDEENPSKIKVIVEKCPTGYFQETNSNCINACRSKHLNLTNIEERYLIYSEGNHIYPTIVYCNYKEGYYNRAGRFLLDYDRESVYEPYFCSGNAEVNNPCVEGQKPLPNGTCVLPCNPNECRDDHNYFICKQTCRDHLRDGHSITVTVSENPDLDTDVAECDGEPWVCENGICKQSLNEHVCQCNPGFVIDGETGRCIGSDVTPQTEPLATGIIFVIVTCVIFVCLMTIITVFCTPKKCKPSGELEDGNSSQHDISSSDTDNAPFPNGPCEEEKEHLLANSNIGDTKSNPGEFKKDADDTNTQAATNCLNKLFLSCGAIILKKKVIGSAFRVGPCYVMTDFHVIRDLSRDLTGKTDYDFSRIEREHNLHVNFNGSFIDKHRRDILLKYRYHDEENDCAVLEIKDTDLHQNLPDPLFLWKYDSYHLRINEAFLIGYGNKNNPNEKHSDKCIIIGEDPFNTRYREALASLHQNAEVYKNDIQERGFDTSSVDRGYYDVENERLFKFDCFLEKGSSGAPVITNEVNSPKVIGLFIGGKPDFFYELSDMQQAAFERKYLFEVGVKMNWIYQRMEREDPDLASEIFPTN
ncbi:uncharacterized protein LOC132715424 [Ruditapes philippinarum]|uniref:uncharacterized protein LOC132715424 n=1 Tax=Ruditapes philippinarum TaxID=129788 RepID=UPI00295C0809|nr:uncharacterized protein LOC132715424 [Ruditapes philippinarum]